MEVDELGTLGVFSDEILLLILSFIDRRHYPILRMVCRKLADMLRIDVRYYSPSNAKKHYNECFDYLLETHQCDLAIWLWDNMSAKPWGMEYHLEHVYKSKNLPFIQLMKKNFNISETEKTVYTRKGRYLEPDDILPFNKRGLLPMLLGAAECNNYRILHDIRTRVILERSIHSSGVDDNVILMLGMLCSRDCAFLAFARLAGCKCTFELRMLGYLLRIFVSCGNMRILQNCLTWLRSVALNTNIPTFDAGRAKWSEFVDIIPVTSTYAKSVSGSVLRVAGGAGNLSVVEFVLQHTQGGFANIKDDKILKLAIKNGHSHIVEWLAQNFPLSKMQLQLGLKCAIELDKKDLVAWMLSTECYNRSLGAVGLDLVRKVIYPSECVIKRLVQDFDRTYSPWFILRIDSPELAQRYFDLTELPRENALDNMMHMCALHALPKTLLYITEIGKSIGYIPELDLGTISVILVAGQSGYLSPQHSKRIIQVFETLHEHGYPIRRLFSQFIVATNASRGVCSPFRDLEKSFMANIMHYMMDHAVGDDPIQDCNNK
jgi:hypothetical protein